MIERADDGSYSAYVPDLPGCTTSGDTADKVRRSIGDAVTPFLGSLREHGKPVPVPRTMADVVGAD